MQTGYETILEKKTPLKHKSCTPLAYEKGDLQNRYTVGVCRIQRCVSDVQMNSRRSARFKRWQLNTIGNICTTIINSARGHRDIFFIFSQANGNAL